MSTPPNKPVRPSAPPPKAAPPPAAPAWSPAKSGPPSNKNLFIILGVAAVVLFLVLTVGLIYALVGGGSSRASPTGPMFPDQTGSTTAGKRIPPNPGPVAHKPRDAVNGFLHELQKDDVGAAYSRTSEGFQTTTTLGQFRAIIHLKPGLRHFTHYDDWKALSPESGVSVHYQGKVTGGPYATVEFTIEVVKERNGWAVREFSPD